MRALVLLLALGAALGILWLVLQDSPLQSAGTSPELPRSAAERESTELRPAELATPPPSSDTSPPAEARSVVRPIAVEDFRGYSVRGRIVRSDGKTARTARVRVWEWEDPRYYVEDYEPFRFESEPLGDGTFEVLVDRQGEFRIWGSAKGECSTDVLELKLNPRAPEAEVELVLNDARRIQGKVLDLKEKPVRGAYVTAFVDVERFGERLPEGLTSVEYWGNPTARSGQDGSFEIYPVDPRARGYELQCRPPRRGILTLRNADGTVQRVRLANLVEVPRVPPGSQGIVITLGEQVDTLSRAELQLSVEGGATPPQNVTYELRQVGPRGSVYFQWTDVARIDVQGFATISDLLPGARYEVRIRERYLTEELCSESFVAHLGTQVVPLVLPFSVEVEVEIRDAKGMPARETTVQVSQPDEDGLNRNIIFHASYLSRWPVRFHAVPGTYRVEAAAGGDSRVTGELVVEKLPVRLVLHLSK